MPEKYTLYDANKIFKKNELFLIENEYIDCKTKMKAKTKDGYFVSKSLDDVLNKENTLLNTKDNYCPISKFNPYSIQNIKKFIVINNIDLELLSTEYKGRKNPLKFIDKLGYLYDNSWDDLNKLIKRKSKNKDSNFSVFGNGNKYTIENIKNYIKVNNINLILISKKFEGSKLPLEFEDNEGYKYSISLELLRQGGTPERFSISNKFTLYNIQKYAQLKGYTLLSLVYLGSEYDLIFKCSKSEHPSFKTSWSEFRYLKYCGCNSCYKEGTSGSNSHNYNPNLTDEERELNRDNLEYKNWRNLVLKRDYYTCQVCGKKSDQGLVVHHLDGYSWCIDGRYDVNNGITLCDVCHKEFHSKYGYKDNTKKQFAEYKNNRGIELEVLRTSNYNLSKGNLTSYRERLLKSRQKSKQRHKEAVNKIESYEYINSYFENDLMLIGYNIKIVPKKAVYIEVKHLLCGNTYFVQASQFISQKKRCGKCCTNYENSLEYYVETILRANMKEFYSEDDNEGIKASTILYKSSTKEYNFKCNKNKNHKLYKTTPELFINSFNNTRSCDECVREYKIEQRKRMNENRRKYTQENILDRISKSKVNIKLDLKSIERTNKNTIIYLTCKNHPQNHIKISSSIFNKKIDVKAICKYCD